MISPEPISPFTLLDQHGEPKSKCAAYVYNMMGQPGAPSDDFVEDSFISMCLDSKTYSLGILRLEKLANYMIGSGCARFYFSSLWVYGVGSLVGVVGIVYSIASIFFHGICYLVRYLQTCDKVKKCQNKHYLEGKYETEKDLAFLEKRLSYINHRNDFASSVLLLGNCCLLAICIFGTFFASLVIPSSIALKRRDRETKYRASVVTIDGKKSAEEMLREEKYLWRCPNERTLLFEKITALKIKLQAKAAAKKSIEEDICENGVSFGGHQMLPSVIIDQISEYCPGTTENIKYQYWQENTC